MMLTVVMECRNQEAELAQTLSGLVAAAVEGLVSDVVILDLGSTDGSARVADAAGCRFHTEWLLDEVLRTVRGEWLLLLEPGSRLQPGWIEEVLEYTALNQKPARFSLVRHHRRPLLRRIVEAGPALECGLLLSKRQALTAMRPGMDLPKLGLCMKPVSLRSQVVPSRAARPGASSAP